MQQQVGFGKSMISVAVGTPLAGFASKTRSASAIHDNLYARALVIKINQQKFCFIQTDLLCLDEESVQHLRNKIISLGFHFTGVFIGATHTHSGPKGINKGTLFGAALDEIFGVFDTQLFSQVQKAVLSAVAMALANKASCTMRYGIAPVAQGAANRNDKQKKGDPFLVALEFVREDQQKILLYHWACHPTILNQHNTQMSADFPGGVSALLEGNPYAMVMFLNGSCGDISTRFTKQSADFSEISSVAHRLVEAIESALANAIPLCPTDTKLRSTTIQLKVKTMDSVAVATQKVQNFEKALHHAKRDHCSEVRLYESRLEGALSNLQLTTIFSEITHIPVEIQQWHLGALIFVFVPGELFSELSNPVRQELGKQLLFFTYFNGYVGYIPDADAYECNTYEALSSPFEKGQGEYFIKSIRRFLCEQ